jgi:hypothetical protein
MAVAAGIALPNLLLVVVRRSGRGRAATETTHLLTVEQRTVVERATRAAWLTPTVAVAVMYLLGYEPVQILFGALLVLAVALNLLLVAMPLGALFFSRRART